MLHRLGRIVFLTTAALIAASLIAVALYRLVPPPATPLMLIRLAEGYGVDREWRPLSDISPHLVRAVMAGEDAKFCLHHGFDWTAIDEAWRRYESGRGKLRGGSTISMQTAKNVFLWPGRDWVRKGFEAYFTVLIEFLWGKHRIMEMYLNVVELGPGLYGAEAASRFYFHKPAAALTEAEAARLAAILPDPLKWSPTRPDRTVRGRAAFIRANMRELPAREPLPCGG
ncbi:MAG TPA: monofunctional biosynthetic peptidoglycan transglycosylase [Stellaceae bacterium]|jgi:monofunctional biosynthetic peptidoglycan transglycosylase